MTPGSESSTYESFSIVDNHINILKWWRDHESILPLLCKVAKKVLTIPASSPKSERKFSTGGNFVTKKISRLAAEKIEDLILTKVNKLQMQEHSIPWSRISGYFPKFGIFAKSSRNCPKKSEFIID